MEASHLWRSHQPGSISGLQSAQAVHTVSSLLTEAAFGGWGGPPLLVQGQTLHAAVHLNTTLHVFIIPHHRLLKPDLLNLSTHVWEQI